MTGDPPLDIAWLRRRLAGRRRADAAPVAGDHDLNPGTRKPCDLVPAAVLVGLIERGDSLHLLLTRRTAHLTHHPGQISFPGGHIEPHDDGPEDTALRETEEETGIARAHVEVIGRLGDYETRTGFRVTPVIGAIRPPFALRPDPAEVAEVFEVPLSFLLDPANHVLHSRPFEGGERLFHAMPFGDYYIWGATAGMLINLFRLLKES